MSQAMMTPSLYVKASTELPVTYGCLQIATQVSRKHGPCRSPGRGRVKGSSEDQAQRERDAQRVPSFTIRTR